VNGYIEGNPLYREFKLDEPWDSKHTQKPLARMPKTYPRPISGKPKKPHAPYYQVFTGPDTPFNPKAGFHVALADGSARYIGRKADEKTLRDLIAPPDGTLIDWDKLPPAKPPAEKR
jgi:hypothetical protein